MSSVHGSSVLIVIPLDSRQLETAEILVFLRSIVVNLSLRIGNSEFKIQTMLFFSSSVFFLPCVPEEVFFKVGTLRDSKSTVLFGANVKPKKFALASD